MRFLTPSNPAGRLEYFVVQLVLYVIAFWATYTFLALSIDVENQEFSYSAGGVSTWLFVLILVIAFGVINVLRRMEDLNLGGGWLICHFIPGVNIVFHLYLLLASGIERKTYAPYGDNPYNPDSWVPKPAPSEPGTHAPAVSYRGQPLLLPGEETWNDPAADEAA